MVERMKDSWFQAPRLPGAARPAPFFLWEFPQGCVQPLSTGTNHWVNSGRFLGTRLVTVSGFDLSGSKRFFFSPSSAHGKS